MELNTSELIVLLQQILLDTSVAKNLVNGKPIDADRKLQGIIARLNNVINYLSGPSKESTTELASPSEESIAELANTIAESDGQWPRA
jgi:hypothetical protein